MAGKILPVLQKLCAFSPRPHPAQETNEASTLLPKDARRSHDEEEGEGFQYDAHNGAAEEDGADPSPPDFPKECLLLSRHRPDPLLPVIKYLMFCLNSVLFTLGAAVLCIGLWGLWAKESLIGENMGNLGTDPMLVFLLVGLMICALSFSGCVGFIRENACLLLLFLAGVTALMVVQCSAAIVVLCFQEQIQDTAKSTMLVAMSRYQDDSDLKFLLDEIQLGMECCGVDSYQDWSLNLYFNCSSPGVTACGVPYSCCIDPLQNGTVPNSQCGFGALGMGEALASGAIYLGGCVPQMLLWLRSKMWDITAIYALAVALEVICLLCGRRVLRAVRVIRSLH